MSEDLKEVRDQCCGCQREWEGKKCSEARKGAGLERSRSPSRQVGKGKMREVSASKRSGL